MTLWQWFGAIGLGLLALLVLRILVGILFAISQWIFNEFGI